MIDSSGLIEAAVQGLEAEGHPGLREQFWELAEERLRQGRKTSYTRWPGIFARLSVRT